MSLHDVDDAFLAQNGLEMVQSLGSGGYGCVYLVKSQKYNQYFALKQIYKDTQISQESEVLSHLDNPNIVRLYGSYFHDGCRYLIEEYCPKTIQDDMNQLKTFTKQELVFYMKGVLTALDFCHTHNVSHGDIKPSNFLLDSYGRVKLCDFGLSLRADNSELCDLYCGSLAFMAPEILHKKPYNRFSADIWSFGVSFYYMATGRLPWRGTTKSTVVSSIIYDDIKFDNIADPQIASLLKSCLVKDPSKRPTPNELLNTPLFQHSDTVRQRHSMIGSKLTQNHSKLSHPIIKRPVISSRTTRI